MKLCVWVSWCGGYYIWAVFGCPRGCGLGDVEVHVYRSLASVGFLGVNAGVSARSYRREHMVVSENACPNSETIQGLQESTSSHSN